eukprot:13184946-Alexandrium_andersonii.AAC.1
MTKFTGDQVMLQGQHVSRMVCGKGRAILEEFGQVLADTAWGDIVPNGCAGVLPEDFFVLVVGLLTLHAGGFWRRLVLSRERFPLLLCWLAGAPRTQRCCERRRECLSWVGA